MHDEIVLALREFEARQEDRFQLIYYEIKQFKEAVMSGLSGLQAGLAEETADEQQLIQLVTTLEGQLQQAIAANNNANAVTVSALLTQMQSNIAGLKQSIQTAQSDSTSPTGGAPDTTSGGDTTGGASTVPGGTDTTGGASTVPGGTDTTSGGTDTTSGGTDTTSGGADTTGGAGDTTGGAPSSPSVSSKRR